MAGYGYTRGSLQRIFSGATHDTFKPVVEVRNVQQGGDGRTFITVADGDHAVKSVFMDPALVQQITMHSLIRLTNYALQDMGSKTFLFVGAAETNLGCLPDHQRIPATSLQKLYHRAGGTGQLADSGLLTQPATAFAPQSHFAAPYGSLETPEKRTGAPQGVERTPEPLFDPGSARGFERRAAGACQAGAGSTAPRPPWETAQQEPPAGGPHGGQLVAAGPFGTPPPAAAFAAAAAPRGSRGSPTQGNFTPVGSLSPYTNGRWRIKCRVLSKTDIRKFTNARGEGQFFKVDLSDASGTTSGTFFGRAVDMFYSRIQVGKVYIFSRGAIKPGNPRFDSSEYVVNFEERSNIEDAGEDSAIPGITYSFKPLADIEQSPPGTLMDIRAVVYSAGEASTFTARSSNKEHTKRDVGLWDGSGADGGCFVDLTLWGDIAQKGGFEVGSVVFLKKARVGEYQGVKNLSSPSSFEVDPDDPEGFSLKARFDALRSRGGMVMPTPGYRSSSGAGGRKTIEAMKEEDLNLGLPPAYGQVPEPGGPRWSHRHHLVATVTQIPNDRMPCYPACPEQVGNAAGDGQRMCQKKVTQESPNLWRCSAGHSCQAPVWRYLCKIEVSDHTDSATVQLYDKQATALFGCDAQQCAQAWESDAADSIIQKALWKTFSLRVRSQKEVWQEVERVKHSVDDLATPAITQEASTMLKEVLGSL